MSTRSSQYSHKTFNSWISEQNLTATYVVELHLPLCDVQQFGTATAWSSLLQLLCSFNPLQNGEISISFRAEYY